MVQSIPTRNINIKNCNMFDKKEKFLFSISMAMTILQIKKKNQSHYKNKKGECMYLFLV